jgi:hypothetical protein
MVIAARLHIRKKASVGARPYNEKVSEERSAERLLAW